MAPASSKLIVSIEGMACEGCVQNIEKNLAGLAGVIKVKVDRDSKSGTVEFDEAQTNVMAITKKIQTLGDFKVTPMRLNGEKVETGHLRIEGQHSEDFYKKTAEELKGKKGIVCVKFVPGENEAEVVYKPNVAKLDDIATLMCSKVPPFAAVKN